MQQAYIKYTDCASNSSESNLRSIFTGRSTIVRSAMVQRKSKSNVCVACQKNIEGLEHKCDLKSFPGKLNNNKENNENEGKQLENHKKLSNNAGRSNKPFVVDSQAARQDIMPISKLPPGGLSYFENLPVTENIYTGPPSGFLNENNLTKFASLLLLPNEGERLAEIDSTTSTRLQKHSSFICPCGYISNAMGRDDHQKECYLSITIDAKRLTNYQSLMPKMCADIELKALAKSTYNEKNSHKNTTIGRTTYYGIETAEKCGRVTKDVIDSNKHQNLKQKAYKCPFCSFWCIDIARFSSHISKHEPQKAYGCSSCEYRSERNFGVSRHIQLRKWKDILHKDAFVLTGNALWESRYSQFKIYIVVTNRPQ